MGSAKPEADAEIILLTNSLMTNLGLQGYAFKIGHIGVIRGILSQEGVDEKTQNAVLQRMDKKEYDAAFKLIESEKCREMLEGLIEIKGKDWLRNCRKNQNLRCRLRESQSCSRKPRRNPKAGHRKRKLNVTVEPAFARGLEYYTGMIFEVYIPQLDIALGGGGRYDRLIEAFGGEPTPAVGCAQASTESPLQCKHRKPLLAAKTQKKSCSYTHH